jgi:acetylornithine deacetylase/succinyl-diaminopimelate desuccinylase-like protein
VKPDSENLATWVSRLVQIPSVNPLHDGPRSRGAGEGKLAAALADFFRELGADTVEVVDVAEGRPNV